MLEAEFEVRTDCGIVHMAGGSGPEHIEECAACGGHVTDIELDDIVGL